MSFLRAHLDTMRDTLRILQGQLDTLNAAVAATEVPSAKPSAQRCDGYDICALVDDEARQSRGSFADPMAWKCRGCGMTSGTNGPM